MTHCTSTSHAKIFLLHFSHTHVNFFFDIFLGDLVVKFLGECLLFLIGEIFLGDVRFKDCPLFPGPVGIRMVVHLWFIGFHAHRFMFNDVVHGVRGNSFTWYSEHVFILIYKNMKEIPFIYSPVGEQFSCTSMNLM